jgi:hypothetical protein
MSIVINGSGTVTGLSVGGLPDGTVDAGTLATDSVVTGKIADGTIANADIADLAASKLTGALPAISGANLTGISSAAGSSHFHAVFTSDTGWGTYNAGEKVAFNATFRNVGSNYSTTHNRYVAPADGVYFFYYGVYTALNDSTNGFQFKKNGSGSNLVELSGNVTTYNEEGAGNHVQTASVCVNLEEDDYIEVWAHTASDVYAGHSSWGGFRIS